MLSRKNYKETIRKQTPTKQHYTIKKLTVGVASVLIGLSFMVGENETVNAETTDKEPVISERDQREVLPSSQSTDTTQKGVVSQAADSNTASESAVASESAAASESTAANEKANEHVTSETKTSNTNLKHRQAASAFATQLNAKTDSADNEGKSVINIGLCPYNWCKF